MGGDVQLGGLVGGAGETRVLKNQGFGKIRGAGGAAFTLARALRNQRPRSQLGQGRRENLPRTPSFWAPTDLQSCPGAPPPAQPSPAQAGPRSKTGPPNAARGPPASQPRSFWAGTSGHAASSVATARTSAAACTTCLHLGCTTTPNSRREFQPARQQPGLMGGGLPPSPPIPSSAARWGAAPSGLPYDGSSAPLFLASIACGQARTSPASRAPIPPAARSRLPALSSVVPGTHCGPGARGHIQADERHDKTAQASSLQPARRSITTDRPPLAFHRPGRSPRHLSPTTSGNHLAGRQVPGNALRSTAAGASVCGTQSTLAVLCYHVHLVIFFISGTQARARCHFSVFGQAVAAADAWASRWWTTGAA
ncbi:hypothetical protein PCL_09721 [Purpureocillium lilacinum]|uniref:Uncharacterized protein n=1 Tax=Purpureocillium lilacinum TaxID=33203 RepID=A0A2U3EDX1_PURLI|nr:hypothetical protein PCL_09721 [Purpureocillium lilacinum]